MKLKVGRRAPDFTLPAHLGKTQLSQSCAARPLFWSSSRKPGRQSELARSRLTRRFATRLRD